MTLYDFVSLKDNDRYQAVWDCGVHLETKQDGIINYLLYSISDFYVEVQYNNRNNTLIANVPFKHGDLLEKYLPEL